MDSFGQFLKKGATLLSVSEASETEPRDPSEDTSRSIQALQALRESEVGVGSKSSFTKPLETPEEVEAHPPLVGRLSLKGIRALVVDDNSTNRRIVCELLEAEGIKTEQAESGEEALEELRSKVESERPYQLAVIDAYMPGLDGFQLAEEVGKDERLGELKLMMLTSGAQHGDGQRCRELGITGYLTKPVSRSDFLQTTIAVLTETERTQGVLITRHTVKEIRTHRRVLLVEDNPVNQKVALMLLTKRGHEVDVAENGEEAVAKVVEGDYHVVLMDVEMPVKDGITATKEIRAMQEYERLPIVALTAHALEGDAERFMAAGMSSYLSKPFKPHELFAAVEEWGIDTSDKPEEVEVEPQETEPRPVDLDSFKASMREAGAEDAVEAMLEVFIDDAPGRIEALESAVAAEDPAAVARASHVFKSATGTIGANGLAELLKESELAGEAGDIDKASGLLERIRPLYELVMEQLRTELED